jgi:CHAD domain-containing protein
VEALRFEIARELGRFRDLEILREGMTGREGPET